MAFSPLFELSTQIFLHGFYIFTDKKIKMIQDIIQISHEAGEIVREGFGKSFGIEYKSNESNLVTDIDRASEKHIKEFIQKKYPSHSILAEEGGETKKVSEYLWVVDPLDGTTNFAHGLPIFSISIGLQKNGNTIAGVVYDVIRDITYYAEKGGGAFAGSQKINVSGNDNLSHSVLATGFPYNISDNPEHALEKFTALTKASRGMRRLGSAAIDFCYVASGIFDGFWEVYLYPWDICAGKLIVEEAGGRVSGFSGEKIDIYTKRILATNGRIHNRMTEFLKN
jgi:myo-inositol-1(or 4)-monophosphatase